MRFLVDAQLPPALARWIGDQGHDAEHVFDIDLETASDSTIWDRAVTMQAVIVTKDEDFVRRRGMASAGPSIVWLRIGNTSRSHLLAWITPLFSQMVTALQRGETVIELR